MLKIKHILCPVDFSQFSARAYEYAQSLARHYRAELHVEHVVPALAVTYPYYPFPEEVGRIDTNLRGEAEGQLRHFVKVNTWDGIKPECIVRQGLVSESILCLAAEVSADLIVMGTHGWRGIDRWLLGSVTEKVLRKACCPVLAVRQPTHDFVIPEDKADPVHLAKILFCTDFSEDSRCALDYALSLGIEYNAEISMLHVLEELPGGGECEEKKLRIMRKLEQDVPSEMGNCCTTKPMVRVGMPYQEIIDLATAEDTDLLVMGVRGRSPINLALFGSTTHRVIQSGPCPVLTVPA